MKKIICLTIFTLFFFISSQAQQYKAILPYEIIGGKMIVEIELNGVPKRAIFDTGAAKNTITEKVMNELGLAITSTQSVTDVNNNVSQYNKLIISELGLPNSPINFKGYDALVIQGNPFECLGVDVLIGSEIFARTILEIDNKTKTITVTSAEKQPACSLRASRQFIKSGYMPIVTVELDNVSIPTLFDTGFGGFFLLRNEDYNVNANTLNAISQSISEGSIGLGGKAADEQSHRVLVNKINFCVAKFNSVIVETSSSPFSLIGTKSLDYGKVTIDYSRQRFYFEPYEKEVIMPQPLNDYSMAVKDGKLNISTVWSSNKDGIENGDIVTHINGKPVPVMDFCESTTVGIKELKVKKQSVLTVMTKNGEKKIKYVNKK